MAHELTIRSNGEAEAFFAGNGKELHPAWHGLGTNVLDAPNSQAAIKFAKLDWIVRKVPAYADVNPTGGKYAPNKFVKSDDFYATVRDDNEFVLGFVGGKYTPVQNYEAFDFLDALNQDGIVKYESAGSLKGGRVVWILATSCSARRMMVAQGFGYSRQRFAWSVRTPCVSRWAGMASASTLSMTARCSSVSMPCVTFSASQSARPRTD